MGVLKRQREQRKAEKRELKRQRKLLRKEGRGEEPAEGDDLVEADSDLDPEESDQDLEAPRMDEGEGPGVSRDAVS